MLKFYGLLPRINAVNEKTPKREPVMDIQEMPKTEALVNAVEDAGAVVDFMQDRCDFLRVAVSGARTMGDGEAVARWSAKVSEADKVMFQAMRVKGLLHELLDSQGGQS